MKLRSISIFGAALVFLSVSNAHAATVDISLTRLSGSVAQGTAIFRADLSSVNFENLLSIKLVDSNSMVGGSSGQYSGFDLDAIKLSQTFASTAAQARDAAGIDVFDFTTNGTIFNPGTQRAPADAKLNGTDASGAAVDPAFATLGEFDAIFFGAGSVTLGDGGSIAFNLKSELSTSNLYLYLGEVSGDAGEALDGSLLVSNTAVPIPAAVWLFGSVVVAFLFASRRS